MAIKVLVVDDRVQSAQALAATNALHGCEVTVARTWAEATDTLTYQHLARSAAPALVIGPLTKEAIDSLGILRGQGIDPPTALYTENRSQDQDQSLISQYRLRTILHKPFSAEDRPRLLDPRGPLRPVPQPLEDAPGFTPEVPLPEAPGLPLGGATASAPGAGASSFEDLIGSTRSSSVRSDLPITRPRTNVDLPSGVQRLLLDPTASASPAAKLAPDAHDSSAGGTRLAEPRSLNVLVIDDRFGTASSIVERVGAPGQRCHITPSYQDALSLLERFMASSMGCELVVGPLSADGVAAVRDYRKRNWTNHVVFYTESLSQSQDARLPLQYGCMTILRRAGMSEPLEALISDLRHHPRQPPAMPQEHMRSGTTRTSAPSAAATGAPPVAEAPTAPKTTDSHIGSPGHPNPPQRIRRSVSPPVPPAGATGALSIDVPGTSGNARQSSQVMICTACRQEFVVTASGNLPVRCVHCQALNQLK